MVHRPLNDASISIYYIVVICESFDEMVFDGLVREYYSVMWQAEIYCMCKKSDRFVPAWSCAKRNSKRKCLPKGQALSPIPDTGFGSWYIGSLECTGCGAERQLRSDFQNPKAKSEL